MDENTPKTNETGNTRISYSSIIRPALRIAPAGLLIIVAILLCSGVFGAIGLALRVGKWMVLQGAVR